MKSSAGIISIILILLIVILLPLPTTSLRQVLPAKLSSSSSSSSSSDEWQKKFQTGREKGEGEGESEVERVEEVVAGGEEGVDGMEGVGGVEGSCDIQKMFDCKNDVTISREVSQCVSLDRRCNGVTDCKNGRDESIPVCGCQSDEFQCDVTSCIHILLRCNAVNDCVNHTDEHDCELFTCPTTHVKCDNHACVPRDTWCDYKNDCGDNSDEASCGEYRKCYDSEWRCNNSQCIANNFLCDGKFDCYDGTDEQNCHLHVRCDNGLFVSNRHRCDGWVDCVDSQNDELDCGDCDDVTQYKCVSSRCIRTSNRCDSVCDCPPLCDDELNCLSYACMQKNSFTCPGVGRCITADRVCDGHNDCLDSQHGSDEEFCDLSESSCEHLWCSRGLCISSAECNLLINCDAATRQLSRMSTCPVSPSCTDVYLPHTTSFSPSHSPSLSVFQCTNGTCISADKRCDGIIDCRDLSDERDCSLMDCQVEGWYRCSSGQCISSARRCDYIRDCLDGEDEMNCEHRLCTEGEYKCRNGQCVALSDLCLSERRKDDGSYIGCADNSHLLNCVDFSCPGGLNGDWLKCERSYCVPQIVRCDGTIDCRTTYTDEYGCRNPCPYPEDSCSCNGTEMDCSNRALTHIPDTRHERGLHTICFGGNLLNHSFGPKTFSNHLSQITYLDISNNSLQDLGQLYFQSVWRLTTLNLERNQIHRLRNGTFYGLINLNTLYLGGNGIIEICPYAFIGLPALKALDLSRQSVKLLSLNSFLGLHQIYTLNLSHNLLEYITDGTFNGLQKLKVLDLSYNLIYTIDSNVFNGFTLLQALKMDEFRFCCLARHVSHCLPAPDEFSSCEDLMSNHILRVCIWVLGLVSICGNTVVIVWRLRDSRDSKVHSFLITNMAVGDLLMGVYLLIIAGVDFHYRGVYILHDTQWRQSVLCRFAGFLSTYSSEISVFTLVVITTDRFVSIIFPFKFSRLAIKHARAVMIALWSVVFIMSALPLANIEYFFNFYGRSGVCLALHITPDKPTGWEYSVFLFLVLNFILLVIIFVSYVWMFVVVRRTRLAARSPQMKTDRAMARRMTLIVLTDFACWLPIVLLGVASLNGATVPPQVYAWIAVFILPLNAAINPILYTVSTSPFMRHAQRKVFRFRASYVNSAVTKPTDTSAVYYPARSGSPSERTAGGGRGGGGERRDTGGGGGGGGGRGVGVGGRRIQLLRRHEDDSFELSQDEPMTELTDMRTIGQQLTNHCREYTNERTNQNTSCSQRAGNQQRGGGRGRDGEADEEMGKEGTSYMEQDLSK